MIESSRFSVLYSDHNFFLIIFYLGEVTVDGETHAQLAAHQNIKETDVMTMGQQAKLRKLWGDNEPRMQAAKRLFDPNGVFPCNIPGV